MDSKKYKTTIGLEIHAELSTQTKMFCNSKNDTEEKRPNVNVCPVCMGHPGTLPTVNKEAVKSVLKVGVALGGKLADFTEFDRKNYFYPDIPKGYQISQYKYPLVTGGKLGGIELTRVHLEEDTAKSSHENGNYSLVDFNRAGVPLMELVTEPVIHSAEEASKFAKELQLLLQYLGVAEANMEKGEMRVEANISVSASDEFGGKVEVKNLNSFRSVERAIEYEVKRHIELLENGEKVAQETRGWDEGKQKTFSQRLKEYSHDYRYFPDPDLPKLYLSEIPEFQRETLEKELPGLPWEKREEYTKKFGLKDEDAEVFVRATVWGKYFEDVISHFKNDKDLIKLASNYITSDLIGLVDCQGSTLTIKILPASFAQLMVLIKSGKLSSRAGKDILKIMYEKGGEPEKIAEKENLLQKSDEGHIKKIVEKIISDNSSVVVDYKSGKQAALQFLIGQAMRETKGSANPEMLKKVFQKFLK
ncbi:MAG: Asp-tRNA(Asn)/Glu-tRNA(Gln) amidotransferase subunit GatB [Parcubacteria group bacterium]|nr:Asp-tRNA(Asn)/Glu-tRNA(Gln) amidotransferase subunit GatB [Parcubacteria group bacterium]